MVVVHVAGTRGLRSRQQSKGHNQANRIQADLCSVRLTSRCRSLSFLVFLDLLILLFFLFLVAAATATTAVGLAIAILLCPKLSELLQGQLVIQIACDLSNGVPGQVIAQVLRGWFSFSFRFLG